VVPARKRTVGKQKAKRRLSKKGRTVAMVAGALAAVSAALSADVAVYLGTQNHPLANGHSTPFNRYYDYPMAITELGATGLLPHDSVLSPEVMHDASDPAALTAQIGPVANLPLGPLGLPAVVLDAYQKAQTLLAAQQPNCHLPWWLLAGIGKIESGQAENGMVDLQGNTLRPILGPELDGTSGFAAIRSSDGGKWTGDSVWERAVGPMQFLPSTWREYGANGNPNNVYDAAAAAGRYLCAGGRDLSDPALQAAAVFSYNHSDRYVQIVLIWAHAYAAGVTPLPETPVPAGPSPVAIDAILAGGLPGVFGSLPPAAIAGATSGVLFPGDPGSSVAGLGGTTSSSATTTPSPTQSDTSTPTQSSSPTSAPSTTPTDPLTPPPSPTCTTPPTPTSTPTDTLTPTPDPGCPSPSSSAASTNPPTTPPSVTPTP
jgi:membrane-bound lytic murein transglycosylase B